MDRPPEEVLDQQLKQAFIGGRQEYKFVHVLLVYWQDGDNPGFEIEATQVGELFKEVFHFSVRKFAIPSVSSELALEVEIGSWLLQNGTQDSLLIIYYGGHGDEDYDRSREWDRQGVWAARAAQDGPQLNWYNIQPKLAHTAANVLLLFDCCFSAQAARARIRVNGRVELLAACGPDAKTPGPGPRSFTSAVIVALKEAIDEHGYITVTELHRQLGKKEIRLVQFPIHVELQPGISSRSIRLEPHHIGPLIIQPAASSMTFQIFMKDQPDEITLRKILTWLKDDAPRNISEVRVQRALETTEKVHQFVIEKPTGDKLETTYQKLDRQAQEEILMSLEKVAFGMSRDFSVLQSFMTRPNSMDDKNHEMFDAFVKKLNLSVISLLATVERNIIAMPGLDSKASLLHAVREKILQDLGLEDILRMRLLSLSDSAQEASMQIAVNPDDVVKPKNRLPSLLERDIDGLGYVLVEYKYYRSTGDGQLSADRQTREAMVASQRVQHLAEVLQAAKSVQFNSLKCLKWFHEPTMERYALAFQVPVGFRSQPVSLYEVIKSYRSADRPSLGHRFLIAWKIGQAISRWHLAGWVHQGIMSRNIFFFKRKGSQMVDFTMPYLGGFEYARPNGAPSYARFVQDFDTNVYNHIERQGEPTQQHRKDHDLYSFGVILCELGLWLTIEECFHGVNKHKIKPLEMQNQILEFARQKLGHYVGDKYMKSTVTCLEGSFGVKEDDAVNSKLSRAFEALVLDRIATGIELD